MSNRVPVVRLVAEALVIVASILLAFGIDAWWNERQERIEETEILFGLSQEFTHNRAILENRLTEHVTIVRAVEGLLAATYRGSWESGDFTVIEALGALIGPPTTDLGSGVLDALLSAGRLQVLTNKELRVKLTGWEGVFEEVHDDEMIGRNFVFDRIIPYLMRWGVPLNGAFLYTRIRSPTSISDDAEAVTRLWADAEFRAILEVRYGFLSHNTGEYDLALVAIDEILGEIELSLSEQT